MQCTIKQVAERFNLTEYAIRYYEKEGLLPSVKRDEHGVRVFDEESMESIKLICCLRSTGMPISQIKNYIDLSLEGDSTLELRRQIILNQKISTEQKIQDMNKHLDMINKKLNYYNCAMSKKLGKREISNCSECCCSCR